MPVRTLAATCGGTVIPRPRASDLSRFPRVSAPGKRSPGGGSVASRTQIVCLHEGASGRSIDPIFIRTLLKALDPSWIRPWKGNNIIRTNACGGRNDLIARMPAELRSCLEMGGETTLMVWADLDHDMENGEQLKSRFW